ncbi:aminotransferase class I/II-fold pyridoxal phosphate-dependent enzyme [Priestia megaterium]|uniref:Arginine decarboxylase n=1 Tax=Priestia megaterium (strain ATCC 14581 / DSM 32 / CCUG 1817 / JCM 2506 / NBRC 15308 / NCIMB 9376 / NCTC 10342 / NRRL B-14308 / VKM B-512 / Ford 19) TaxID=1348623 RepID=A0A0B6AIG2_PRIM2|nr:aminotransferase class I/II-fold pyridoxal phosphate-dependent enzyme [Priestia megaterium]AJI20378.1 arginine decarboxylase [Priestia megaterium NBRC 15308 = ATCC 14581]KFM97158.1 arginine decarboxylase [Priestia megaterium]KGJ81371.1 arginine decarboxylase [Priestia megaterium NBRC 15308 = ATCC 14581]MDR4230919.1 aminotransferase class I/II-fold pyridoxal phosphate-dependent enzyme [Priestia megaterium]MED3810542.1 aminotransferase class I/II-fold pyridoxal phosphate-dependent enzyme [Pri
MYSQFQTPLFTALLEHANKNPIQFHIPGHKKGNGMDPEFKGFIGENALSIDLINIAPLDDLHQPRGVIKQAQDLAAEAFGADHTFFSIQGTSGVIMAMIMSVCGPGDKIIVPRNVHKSIMSGIVLSGATPIFIHPQVDPDLGISHGVPPESIEEALKQHPDAKAVLVINPTYFGIAGDLRKIVEITHSYNIPVLVDEAHGVHIHFHDELPLSAMQAGADMAATSVHKLGGSMTQSSILNVQGTLVSPERVQAILSMLTTTSTSYILLASLDAARKSLATEGQALLEETIRMAEKIRGLINRIEHLYCAGSEILGTSATFAIDQTKLVISVKELGVTGYAVEKWLREKFNIEVELSDLYNILCIITPGDNEEDVLRLVHALKELSREFKYQSDTNINTDVLLPEIPLLALTPRDAFYAETEVVPFEESIGRIIAEFVMVYPPGIPIFIPGEIITEENVLYTKKNIEAGLPVQGAEDLNLKFIRVLKEHRDLK